MGDREDRGAYRRAPGAGGAPAGDKAGDAPLDDNPEIDRSPPPRFVFFAALIANGWFLRAKSFMYSPGVESVPSRFKAAFSRWLLFGLFWIVQTVQWWGPSTASSSADSAAS